MSTAPESVSSPAADRPSAPGPASVGTKFLNRLGKVPPWTYALLVYVASAAVVFRDGIGSGADSFPQGTNALDSFQIYWWVGHHPDETWLFPFTDWGQPLSSYTGPTVTYPAMILLSPGTVVRGLEAAAWVGSGLSMYWLVRGLEGSAIAAIVAGFYYENVVQTPQLFEGHIPIMVALAVGPAFFLCLGRFLLRPTLPWGAGAVAFLYLLVTLGDLGTLYEILFFALPLAAYLLVRGLIQRRYTLRQLGTIAGAATALVVLVLPWLYPYALGDRPQYTTTITSPLVSFSAVTGQNLGYSFLGYDQENSFIHYTYHQLFFSFDGRATLWVYLAVPLLVLGYVVVAGNWHRLVLYLSGVLTLLFSGGRLYPWLSPLNRWFWTTVPFFNTNPALIEWTKWTVFVYAVLLGLSLTAIERWATGALRRPSRPWWQSLAAGLRWLRNRWAPPSAPPSPSRRWRLPSPSPTTQRGLVVAVIGVVAASTVVQTSLVDTRPPGFFQFPSGYTAGFSYIADRPVTGEILTVPFGTIYERTPWGGLSESSLYMGPYFTGADTALFEAGTAPSLAIDDMLEGALQDGTTRNLTKLLPGLNVQYVLSTDYPDWKYANAVAGNPQLGYAALANQSGLPPPSFQGGYQSVFAVADPAGNLSFWPEYVVYYGAGATLPAILDSSWYPGLGLPLVDANSLGTNAPSYLAHAAAVVIPVNLLTAEARVLNETSAAGVPVVVLGSGGDFLEVGGTAVPHPWNGSGGIDTYFPGSAGEVGLPSTLSMLYRAGYRSASLSTQIACAPEGDVTLAEAGPNATERVGPSITSTEALPWSSPGYVTANATNAGPGYPGNVSLGSENGTPALEWSFQPDSSDFQYLALPTHNLSGSAGLAVQLAGDFAGPLEAQLVINGSVTDLPGYESLVPIGGISPSWFFSFPEGVSPTMNGPLDHLGNVTEVRIGLPTPVWQDHLTVTGISLFTAPTSGFGTLALGNLTLGENVSYRLHLDAPCSVNLVTAIAAPSGSLALTPVASHYPKALPDAADLSVSSTASGWGLFVLAQTYSPLWSATVAGGIALHAVADVGLNAWLADPSAGATVHVWYEGDVWEGQAIEITAGLAGAGAIALAVVLVARRRRRRASAAGPEAGR